MPSRGEAEAEIAELAQKLLVAYVAAPSEDASPTAEYARNITRAAFEIAEIFIKERNRRRGDA